MDNDLKSPSGHPLVGFETWLRTVIREELTTILETQAKTPCFLTPEELAARLRVPVTWVYEQSRQGKIPTHRIGRYIRFDVGEVIASQKALK